MPSPHQARKTTPCIQPGCSAPVRAAYIHRLCLDHRHAPGLCGCKTCQKRDAAAQHRAARMKAATPAPGTYRYHPGTAAERAPNDPKPVTLPRPAWMTAEGDAHDRTTPE